MTENGIHPLVRRAKTLLADGKMERREFLRLASLLGVSAGLASVMGGGVSPATAAENDLPFPPNDPKAKIGGVLRAAMKVPKIKDPATFDAVEMANQASHVLEHLSMIGPDNIAGPMLAERWSASKNLRTWTVKLRKGVMWHNGDELVAEHVAWNVRRWLDPSLGAGGITGLSTFAAMLSENGLEQIPGSVEVIDTYTVRFKLKRPVLSVMEDFAHYPAAICHPSFKAPLSDRPIGTGPFTIDEHISGEACILTLVTETEDGQPFEYWGGDVYLSEIHYYESEQNDDLAAYAAGDVDFVHEILGAQVEAAKGLEAEIHSAKTARTLVCRMQTSQEPFNDIRVREAVVRSVDNAELKTQIVPWGGDVGENHHVAPIQPDYSPLKPQVRDVEKSKELLIEARCPDESEEECLSGMELTVLVGDVEGGWHKQLCESMAKQMLEAGIKLSISVVSPEEFGTLSKDAAFAAVPWSHRPLGTMTLSLAYRTGSPWNETHFANPEFDSALDKVEATLDMKKRRSRMKKAERILRENFLMIQPFFLPVFVAASNRVHGFTAHSSLYHQFRKVWVG